jgi:two-component system, LuxR family, sensor histidine kinase DctS
MSTSTALPGPSGASPRRLRLQRALPWAALLLLLGVAQTLLVVLTVRYETARAQDDADNVAAAVAAELRRELTRTVQTMQALGFSVAESPAWRDEAAALLRQRQELRHLERRDPELRVLEDLDTPFHPLLFSDQAGQLPRSSLGLEAELTCTAAGRSVTPMFSRSYFVPQPGGLGLEVLDLCVPVQHSGRITGFLVGSFALSGLLEAAVTGPQARRHELTFIEGDGTRLARAGLPRGAGVYQAERVVDMPGGALRLRADSATGHPSLIPNVTTALVLGLSLALFGVVLMLARDVRRRAIAESALAEALAFRKAMEDSLITGLRARDLQGAISYVNPAFCAMVGFSADELRAAVPPALPPYWPPEHVAEYLERQRSRMDDDGLMRREAADRRAAREGRGGFETVFMRKSGERFPVMIYEAPLVDGQGRHTGWMSAVLDVSAQRSVEELSRQQQERLQATARLATVGEMASLLSHELNQPLSAIASYATGSLNLLQDAEDRPDALPPGMLADALTKIAEQAERAGRVIKSVHDFVRRREQQHETLGADQLLEAVLPLVRLQARKSGTRIDVDLQRNAAGAAPRVRCDRTMLEQVLLNLTRNAIQAMETDATPPARRVLRLRVQQTTERWVSFHVIDAGPGIAPDVAGQLFRPFFTTRSEGMGLGLSLCRTVIEQHGGALDFGPVAGASTGNPGTDFRFTLPAPRRTETASAVGTDPSTCPTTDPTTVSSVALADNPATPAPADP